ncbi:MAG: hypothetical protein AAGF84_03915 [Planctomycetota bacterium]
MKTPAAELQRRERELTDASVEVDGVRYVRAQTFCGVLGCSDSYPQYLLKRRRVRGKRVRIAPRHRANRGVILALRLDDALRIAASYRSPRVLHWSDAEDEELLARVGRIPLDALAGRLGRTTSAVRKRLQQLDESPRTAGGELTTGQVARLANTNKQRVIRWCESGRVVYRRTAARQSVRLIDPGSLAVFLPTTALWSGMSQRQRELVTAMGETVQSMHRRVA